MRNDVNGGGTNDGQLAPLSDTARAQGEGTQSQRWYLNVHGHVVEYDAEDLGEGGAGAAKRFDVLRLGMTNEATSTISCSSSSSSTSSSTSTSSSSSPYLCFRKRSPEHWRVGAQVRPHVTIAAACFAVQDDALFVLLLLLLLLLLHQLQLLSRWIQPRQAQVVRILPTKLLRRGPAHLQPEQNVSRDLRVRDGRTREGCEGARLRLSEVSDTERACVAHDCVPAITRY